jgi:muconolactone delta-isomerase
MGATSIRLDADFVDDVKAHADAQSRSVPANRYWAKIGRIAEDNPDSLSRSSMRFC